MTLDLEPADLPLGRLIARADAGARKGHGRGGPGVVRGIGRCCVEQPAVLGVADLDGIGYAYSAFGEDPALVGTAVRADRGVTEGWVTFEVAEGTSRLEVSESRLFDDPLTWVVER